MSKADKPRQQGEPSRWEYPDITSDEHFRSERRNAVNKPMRWQFEPPEDDVEETPEDDEQPSALTAAMLEEIRREAQQEGFSQGHDEGVKAGHEEGYKVGYEEGLLAGREAGEQAARVAGEQATAELKVRWQQLFEHMRYPALQINEAVERQLVAMTASLAQAVCFSEVRTNPEVILKVVQTAVAELSEQATHLTLSLHPQDLELIKQQWDDETRHEMGWKLNPDESLTRGGCIVSTPVTRVDATLEARIADVFKNYIQGLAPGSGGPMRAEPKEDAVAAEEQQAKEEAEDDRTD